MIAVSRFNAHHVTGDITAHSGPDGDLLSRLGLSSSLRTIVEREAAQFEATGDWVDFDTLADEAA